MSYEMFFWRQTKECRHRPTTIVKRLCEGGKLEGLVEIPIAKFTKRLSEAFPGFDGQIYQTKSKSWYFTTDWIPPFGLQVVMDRPVTNETMKMANTLIEVAGEFKCALFDPQTNQRYE